MRRCRQYKRLMKLCPKVHFGTMLILQYIRFKKYCSGDIIIHYKNKPQWCTMLHPQKIRGITPPYYRYTFKIGSEYEEREKPKLPPIISYERAVSQFQPVM